MTGLVLVTHGGVAGALLDAASMIIGETELTVPVQITPEDNLDSIMSRVLGAVAQVGCDGCIIMTDMFGGTPSNMAMSCLKEGAVEVVTGVNLPMLMEFFSKRTKMQVPELAEKIRGSGCEGIIIAGEFLKK